jgi:hypothetical protein
MTGVLLQQTPIEITRRYAVQLVNRIKTFRLIKVILNMFVWIS